MGFLKRIFRENSKLKDKFSRNKEKYIQGHVIVKDLEGNVILEKDNLVLLRTRIYLFEHLFKSNPPAPYNNDIDNDRFICLFKIGQGGADVNATPFNPFVPKFSDTDLAQPVPFIIVDPDKSDDIEKEANPSFVTELPVFRKNVGNESVPYNKYFLPVDNQDGSLSYYGKIFENDNNDTSNWNINTETGEVSYTLKLKIEPTEARGFMVNEIGLLLAKPSINNYNIITNIANDYKLATRITFDTESLTSLSKGLEIDYVMYI